MHQEAMGKLNEALAYEGRKIQTMLGSTPETTQGFSSETTCPLQWLLLYQWEK